MVCLGNQPRSFCSYWDCTQAMHFKSFVDYRATPFLLRDFSSCSRYNDHLKSICPFLSILVHEFLRCQCSPLPFPTSASQSFQLLNHDWYFATPWTSAHQASLSITNSHSLLKLMSIESVMPSYHLISTIHFSSWLQSYPASRYFWRVSSSHQVAKISELQLQHQSFQWIFRTDFL